MRGAAALAFAIALALPRGAGAQVHPDRPPPGFGPAPAEEPATADEACDPLGEFACVYTPGPGAAELRTVIDAAEWAMLPMDLWRTSAVVGMAPGVLGDELGQVIGGASSLESRWELDGLEVSDPWWGGAPSALGYPAGLLGRVVVRRGGLGAEQRGSAGGVVSFEAARGGDRFGAGALLVAARGNRSTGDPPPPDTSGLAWTLDTTNFGSIDLVAGAGGAAWQRRLHWAVGVEPRITSLHYTRTVSRYTDSNQDGVRDTDDDGNPILEPLEILYPRTHGVWLPVLARVDVAPVPAHSFGLTAAFHPAFENYYMTGDGEIGAAARRYLALGGSASADWHGRFGATTVEAGAGFTADLTDSRSPDAARNRAPQIVLGPFDSFVGHESAAVQRGCDDTSPDDPYPLIANCPLIGIGYFTGGVGQIIHESTTRVAAHAGADHALQAAGVHRLRAGGEVARTGLFDRTELSGGYQVYAFEEERYVAIGDGPELCAGAPCRFLDRFDARSAIRSAGLYAADAWSPRRDLTIDAGGRLEWIDVDDELTLTDVEPRLSVAWDPLGHGRSRLFASTGRYVAVPPLAIAEAFHAPTLYTRVVDPDTGEISGEQVYAPIPYAIPGGLGPMRVNELAIGGEAALGDELRVGISYLRRDLGRILEDVRTGGGGASFANPIGRRDYDELAVELRSNPARPLTLRASYTYSRLRGDYQGYVQTSNRQASPGTLTAFDFPELAANADGPLPADRPHALDVAASYRFGLGRWGALTAGARAIAASGTPRNALGRHYVYALDEVFVLPRGSIGRTPPVTYLGARLAWAYPGRRIDVVLDLQDLFARQEISNTDDTYTFDNVSAIVGGDPSDLIFLKRVASDGSETATPATRNPDFARPHGHYAPGSIWLGLRWTY